mmetsp:Transcript_30525/g.49395  ORF Transcript_30525/g.49395 Transcript_30525/m.49395 type:complete len:106 (+) Transcript_30525:808-1125(+)
MFEVDNPRISSSLTEFGLRCVGPNPSWNKIMSTLPKLCIDVESKDVSYVDIIAPTKVVVLKGISQTLTEVDPYTISPSAYVFGGDGSLRDAFRSNCSVLLSKFLR